MGDNTHHLGAWSTQEHQKLHNSLKVEICAVEKQINAKRHIVGRCWVPRNPRMNFNVVNDIADVNAAVLLLQPVLLVKINLPEFVFYKLIPSYNS